MAEHLFRFEQFVTPPPFYRNTGREMAVFLIFSLTLFHQMTRHWLGITILTLIQVLDVGFPSSVGSCHRTLLIILEYI